MPLDMTLPAEVRAQEAESLPSNALRSHAGVPEIKKDGSIRQFLSTLANWSLVSNAYVNTRSPETLPWKPFGILLDSTVEEFQNL